MDPLDQAFARLQKMLPDRPSRALGWLHNPPSRYVRLPLGLTLILLSPFSFLPIIGIEFLPIGLLLIAQDVPVLRKPVGKGTVRLLDGADRLVKWWKKRRAR